VGEKKMGKMTKRETRTRERRDKQKGILRGRKRKGWKRRRKQEDQNDEGKEKVN